MGKDPRRAMTRDSEREQKLMGELDDYMQEGSGITNRARDLKKEMKDSRRAMTGDSERDQKIMGELDNYMQEGSGINNRARDLEKEKKDKSAQKVNGEQGRITQPSLDRTTPEGIKYSFEGGKFRYSTNIGGPGYKMTSSSYINHLMPTYDKKGRQTFCDDTSWDKSFHDSYTDKNGYITVGGSKGTVHDVVRDQEEFILKNIVARQCVYNDLNRRDPNTLSDAEKSFMNDQRKVLQERGLEIMNDGFLEYKDCPPKLRYNNQHNTSALFMSKGRDGYA